MIKYVLDKLKEVLGSRLFWLSIVYGVLAFVLLHRMFELQIVQKKETTTETEYLNVVERYIPSTRGMIYDRNGVLLAYNELSYSIMLEDNASLSTNAQKNASIHTLLSILKEHGYELELDFSIELDENGQFVFNESGNALLRFKKNAYGRRSTKDLSDEERDATAEEVFQFLRSGNKASAMFQVSEEYTLEEALEIVTVRYHFFTMVDKSSRLTIASNVDDLMIAAVLEAKGEVPGVSVVQRTQRVYNHGFYFAHIIGYTGLATEADLVTLNGEDGKGRYETSDYIGKTGLEREMEHILSGKKGVEHITLNSSGKVIDTEVIEEPVPGNSIYLTLDVETQKAYYYIIEKNLAEILCEVIVEELDYGTKGTNSEEIKIPVYEVYYALFSNHVLNMDHLSEKQAGPYEKRVHKYFEEEMDSVINEIYRHLTFGSTEKAEKLSESMQDYLAYFMSQMQTLGLLPKAKIDTSDSAYKAYTNGNLSTSEYLMHSINKQWVDLEALGIDETYYSTDEIYDILIDRTMDSLYDNREFYLKIFRKLIFNDELSGREICLLLFEQNVIEYNETDATALKKKTISAYDFILQKIRNVEITPAQLALEPCSGTVVQTDTATGAVTALVTYPSYEINQLANKIEWSYYSKLLEDKSNPLYNRATQQRTTTGSTIKMMTAVSGLLNNKVGIAEKIYDEVTFTKINPSPSCWSSRGHGEQDIANAIMNSCNFFFYEVGYRLATDVSGKYSDSLGLSKLKETGKLFGLTQTSGVELGEAAPEFATTDAVRASIGYGYHFTPLQISRYATTIATKGTLYKYTIISKIVDKDHKLIYSQEPVIENTITDIRTGEWTKIHEGMRDVILKYSTKLKNAYADIPVSVGGKTGSAQVSANIPPHSVFVSFAPLENPEISVTAVIANGYSGTYSGLLCRDIYGYYYNGEFRDYLNISNEEGEIQ